MRRGFVLPLILAVVILLVGAFVLANPKFKIFPQSIPIPAASPITPNASTRQIEQIKQETNKILLELTPSTSLLYEADSVKVSSDGYWATVTFIQKDMLGKPIITEPGFMLGHQVTHNTWDIVLPEDPKFKLWLSIMPTSFISEEEKNSLRDFFRQTTEAVNWKTYRNDKFRFEFRYPADWLLDDQANKTSSFTLKPYKNSGSFLFFVLIGPKIINIHNETVFDEEEKDARILKTTFAGRSSYEFPRTLTDIGGGVESFNRAIRIIDLEKLPWNERNYISYQVWYTELGLAETFDQILSTFKFLN